MCIFKIPFIVASLIGEHVAYTAPVPPAVEHKKKFENVPISMLSPCVKVIFWALALIELITILANTRAAHAFPVSQKILIILFHTGNANMLRITPHAALGTLLIVSGAAIRAACYRKMGKLFTFDLSIQKQHKLVTSGLYGIVRHPSYTGSLMVTGGTCLFHLSSGSLLRESTLSDTEFGRLCIVFAVAFTLFPLPVVGYRMQLEDNALRSEFGRDWDNWAKEVPYRLIPGVY
ncbi:hypothetical protein BDZ94DRAFT_1178689 [Collybia nuda]|uniref:Protein-S-isoprenylcysteine O-methyltransferase n=1 Tax=Collybia nuda TaxID=64659 RepID=A0A9P5XQV5_9AGAR|nr:hypothetical protein BDZ94DRAFT_1178689 [Collybia nuda]